jgi:hypothetical protein
MSDERGSHRPGQDSATSEPLVMDCDQDSDLERRGRGATLLTQLRRRHDAALRLPPLEHSRRRDALTQRERADGRARP